MPWPKRYHLAAGSMQKRAGETQRARRVNRHSRRHVNSIYQQVLLLEQEEKAVLQERALGNGEGAPYFDPVRGVRREGESQWAVWICNDYILLPRRSLTKLHKQLQRDERQGLSCKTPSLDTLKSWSRRYQWQARALLFDAETKMAVWAELERRRSMRELAHNGVRTQSAFEC